MTFTVYRNAVEQESEEAKGLVQTNQGGMAYLADELKQLKRFLILGTEGGTFYASEQKLTKQNIKAVKAALDKYDVAAIELIADVSDRGLAPKNDPALLALAMAASYKSDDKAKQERIRSAAYAALPRVARIGTHLFHFVDFVNSMRGWGSGLRNAVSNWYLEKSPMELANQITKYAQRDGWSHRDVLRKAHPIARNTVKEQILGYAVKGAEVLTPEVQHTEAVEYLQAVESVKHETDSKKIVDLITTYNLPREVLPTAALVSADVWDALLRGGKGMPIHALLRNLGNLAKHGLFSVNSEGERYVIDRLEDGEKLRRSRLHPIDVIKAKLIYGSGQGYLGGNSWSVSARIVEELEEAFYRTFDNIEPTNKRGILGIDVSASMGGGTVAGIPGFTPCMAASVMAMVTARVEKQYVTLGFANGVTDLGISRHDKLEAVMRKAMKHNFGGTNHAALFDYARNQKFPADYFIVYTDNETGYGNTTQAIRNYRKAIPIHDAKVITVGMTATQFTIADPTDVNMLDVVGFSTDTPTVMSEFIRGNI